MTTFVCSNCGKPFPRSFAYRCHACGGIYTIDGEIELDLSMVDAALPGIWRYGHSLGLPENTPSISLGEGNTPLIWVDILNSHVGLKLEYQNPTGSYKDRLMAPLVAYLYSLGVESAVEDSSGNAGASFAAYAARAGIKARVFVPAYASGPKRDQIKAHGAEVISFKGSRTETSKAVLEVVESESAVYASHAYLPHGLPGIATIAYELYEQTDTFPGTIIVPVGHGSLILGLIFGYRALLSTKVIKSMPKFIGVQASHCAPIWTALNRGLDVIPSIGDSDTVAEGIRVLHPLRGKHLLELSKIYDIDFIAVDEDRIIPGRDCLARLGFYVEPTSAVVWDALQQVLGGVPEPIVLILTGSGLKHINS
jgi:threonine synthase